MTDNTTEVPKLYRSVLNYSLSTYRPPRVSLQVPATINLTADYPQLVTLNTTGTCQFTCWQNNKKLDNCGEEPCKDCLLDLTTLPVMPSSV